MLCGINFTTEFSDDNNQGLGRNRLEQIRKGQIVSNHILNKCSLPDFEKDYRIVDFRRVMSLTIGFIRELANKNSPRLLLLPPYREHLAQAFARFFMRVGLPVDIPKFK